MTTATHAAIPDPHERAALNDRLRAHGQDSGFYDDQGRPAPWPDDIEEWRPSTSEPITLKHGEQPF